MRHLGKSATTVREKNDDRIIDIQQGFLTSELTMQEQFTPGGFDDVKRNAYELSAYKQNSDLYSLSDITRMSNNEIKALAKKKQNLVFAQTQIAYHKQNMVAAKLIGIFAVANISHAVMSQGNAVFVPKTNKLGHIIDRAFTIDGHHIGGSAIVIDPIKGFYGERVSHVLAQFLAASVDAVKDPVLNLMNINIQSVNIAITLARLGFGIRQIGLFLNQPIIAESVREATTTNKSLATVVRQKLKELNVDESINIDLTFSSQEWENTLLKSRNEVDDTKQLLLAQQLLSYAESFQNIATFTRQNSIASGVGPRIVNNLFAEQAVQLLRDDTRLSDSETIDTIGNPICGVFYWSLRELTEKLFTPDRFIAQTDFFKRLFTTALDLLKYNFDESAALKLVDTVTSLYTGRGLNVDIKKTVTEFPAEFVRRRDLYKEKFGSSMILDWIQLDNSDSKLPVLTLKTRGASTEQLQDLKASFDEVLRNDKEFCLDIIKYIYSRNGFGFSPKTFSKEITNRIKLEIPGYLEALKEGNDRDFVETLPIDILTQFCLNNGIYTGELRDGEFIVKGDSPRSCKVFFKNKRNGNITEVDSTGLYKVTNSNEVYVQIVRNVIQLAFGLTETANHLKELGYSGNIFEYYQDGVSEETEPIIDSKDAVSATQQSSITPEYTNEVKVAAQVIQTICNLDAELINKSLESFKLEQNGDVRYLRAQTAAQRYLELTNLDLTISTPKLGQGIAQILMQMEQKGLSADKLIELIIETSLKQNVCN